MTAETKDRIREMHRALGDYDLAAHACGALPRDHTPTSEKQTAQARCLTSRRVLMELYEEEIKRLRSLLERSAMFIDCHVSHDHEGCRGDYESESCSCGKRALLAEIDAEFVTGGRHA